MSRFRPVFFARPKEGEEEGWHLSLADLMALLLCFFILLAAISSFNARKYQNVAKIMAQAMGVPSAPREEIDLDELQRRIASLLNTAELVENVEVRRRLEGVVVDIRGGLLFPSAEARLNESAEPILTAMAARLKATDYQVEVEGHTDDLPIATDRFPSNWELSAARAAAVARFLINEGLEPKRLTIIGRADTRPLAANDSPSNRARNRRVSLVITAGP